MEKSKVQREGCGLFGENNRYDLGDTETRKAKFYFCESNGLRINTL